MMKIEIGQQVKHFELPGVDGRDHSLSDYQDSTAIVVIFSCNHCPYAQAWEDRIVQIQSDYEGRDVQILMISANDAAKYPEDSFPLMKERAKQKGFNFPYLFDESQSIARSFGAERTPEVFVFDNVRNLRYHGAIDDNYEDPENVGNTYLRDALDSILSGSGLSVAETEAVGCTIKWKI